MSGLPNNYGAGMNAFESKPNFTYRPPDPDASGLVQGIEAYLQEITRAEQRGYKQAIDDIESLQGEE